MILTGQRRSEVANLSWSEIDLAAKVWTLPAARAKNGRVHSVPLSAAALAIIGNFPNLKSDKLSIFEPVSFSRMKSRLDAAISLTVRDLPPWTLHDLRRTCASGMASLGVRIETVEKILNHASGSFRGIVGVYQKYDFASEKRAALDLWGANVAALPASSVALSKAA